VNTNPAERLRARSAKRLHTDTSNTTRTTTHATAAAQSVKGDALPRRRRNRGHPSARRIPPNPTFSHWHIYPLDQQNNKGNLPGADFLRHDATRKPIAGACGKQTVASADIPQMDDVGVLEGFSGFRPVSTGSRPGWPTAAIRSRSRRGMTRIVTVSPRQQLTLRGTLGDSEFRPFRTRTRLRGAGSTGSSPRPGARATPMPRTAACAAAGTSAGCATPAEEAEPRASTPRIELGELS